MNRIVLTSLAATCAALLAQAGPKEDVKAAAQKLADAANYSWTATTEIEGGQFTPTPVNGKAEKAGFAVLTQERDGNVTTAVLKGDKGVIKMDDGWKTAEELRAANQGGGGGGGGMRGAMLLRSRAPAQEIDQLVEKTKELKSADGAISGDLTEDGAKSLLTFGRGRPGGQAPEAKNAKGSIKVWLKDGQIAKLQVKVSGTMTGRNGQETDRAMTRTVEIKDVGTTKVEVPEDAKKKLGA